MEELPRFGAQAQKFEDPFAAGHDELDAAVGKLLDKPSTKSKQLANNDSFSNMAVENPKKGSTNPASSEVMKAASEIETVNLDQDKPKKKGGPINDITTRKQYDID